MIVLGAYLRIYDLARPPLWVDETESCINALTILQHGYPVGNYLGLPTYENTLVFPWPGHPEYAFRDASYSNQGLALYHGWLPLYAIAAAFRVAGIHADNTPSLTPRYDKTQRTYRTIIPRLPAVLFGLLSLIGLYLAGSRLHSRQAGLLAAFLASGSGLHIVFSQQARYYGAVLAVTSFCAWSIACMVQRRRLRDFAIGGLLFGALFHTHLISFLLAGAVWTAAIGANWWRRGWRRIGRNELLGAGLFGAVILAIGAPWIWATGFLSQNSGIPKAWRLIHSPGDLIVAPFFRNEYSLVLSMGLVMLVLASMKRGPQWLQRLKTLLLTNSRSYALLYFWVITGYLSFMLIMPAASVDPMRLALTMLTPTLLVLAMLVCSFGRLVSEKRHLGIAVAACALFLLVSNVLHPLKKDSLALYDTHSIDAAADYLRQLPISPATRLFATPNEHLLLTYYTGIPVQSIAPIRESFLSSYPNDIYFFEKVDVAPSDPISAEWLSEVAEAGGREMSPIEAQRFSCEVASYAVRQRVAPAVARVEPPLHPIPANYRTLVFAHEQVVQMRESELARHSSQSPMFYGMQITTVRKWWNSFFYRFIDPAWHEAHPNYASRMRNATVTTLPCANWAVYFSPGKENSRPAHEVAHRNPSAE